MAGKGQYGKKSSAGGSGLNPDGSQIGATAQAQEFTNGAFSANGAFISATQAQALIDASVPCITYAALLTQAGTDDGPVETLLSGFSENIVYARVSTGFYTGTLVGAFPADRTLIPVPFLYDSSTDILIKFQRFNDDIIGITTTLAGVNADDILNNYSAYLMVYPT